jgi:hypothetical protein
MFVLRTITVPAPRILLAHNPHTVTQRGRFRRSLPEARIALGNQPARFAEAGFSLTGAVADWNGLGSPSEGRGRANWSWRVG